MPILSIISQPATNSLNAAYRPIVLTVTAQRTDLAAQPPVVFCDVYVNGLFYKSLAKTQFSKLNVSNTEWTFDVQDVVQEYLSVFLASYGGSSVTEATPVSARVYCKFRSSGLDANGFIATEGSAPVQGTSSADPVQGTGTAGNEFFVINAVLQHTDSQQLATHLQKFKTGSWSDTIYPLTQRPLRCLVTMFDDDYFPVFDAAKTCYQTLVLNYRLIGQALWRQQQAGLPAAVCDVSVNAITANQVGSDIEVSWTFSGTPDGFRYRLDGGPWMLTAANSITLFNPTDGPHTIDVLPFCNCTEGADGSLTFTKVPLEEMCVASITAIGGVQIGVSSITFTLTGTGSPASYNYRVDGGAWINTASNPFTVTGLAPGYHFLEVVPKCANGSVGVGSSGGFNLSATAIYQPINYNNSNGNHQIQRSFDDGKTNVNYRIFCSASATHQGPFNAAFSTGVLISSVITGSGPHCNTSMTDKIFTP